MIKTSKGKATTDAIEILRRRHYGGCPDRIAAVAQADANDTVA